MKFDKTWLRKAMDNGIPQIIGWIIVTVALVAVIIYIARTKLNQSDGATTAMASMLKNEAIQVQSIVNMQEQNNYPLVDYHIAGSYNSCCSGNTKDAEVSLEPLKMVLSRGVRLVDFEIYMLPDNSVVIASGHNPLRIKNESGCQDTIITSKGSYNHVNIKQAFSFINSYGFSVSPNSLDPIFINLRIKSKCLSCFDVLKNEIKEAFSGRLLPVEYSKEGTMVRPQRKKLEFLKMKNLKGKVIIMCEDYCKNFRDNSGFHQLVNLSTSGNLRKYTNDDIKNIDATKYTKDNRDKFAMVVPDDTHPITQTNSFGAIT